MPIQEDERGAPWKAPDMRTLERMDCVSVIFWSHSLQTNSRPARSAFSSLSPFARPGMLLAVFNVFEVMARVQQAGPRL
jgi:hypothetical protein